MSYSPADEIRELRRELTRLRDEHERLKEHQRKTTHAWQQAEAKLACVAQVEQEMREYRSIAVGNYRRKALKWADTLASLRNDQRAEHTCHDMNPPFPGPCLACGREKGQ